MTSSSRGGGSWLIQAVLLLTLTKGTHQIAKNFVNASTPELRPTFVVNFDTATVICQHSSDPSDLHIHNMSSLCDGKQDCFSNPAMHDEVFPYCEHKCESTCSGKGACLYDGMKPQCYCDSGFSGKACELQDKNECLEHPCHLMAQCQNTLGSYECRCLPGYTGNGHQCVDINECEEKLKETCPENSQCINLPGTYYCNCTQGFAPKGNQGSGLDRCADINECETGANNCEKNEICENTIGSFKCVTKCSPGYKLIDGKCEDVDECGSPELHRCDTRAECVNTIGGYTCECDEGFVGDGKNCQPKAMCSKTPGVCDRHANCLPKMDLCVCKSGYAGDGVTCNDVNECDALENPCAAGGRCLNLDGGYVCCKNEQSDNECVKEQGAFCSGGCGLNAVCANQTCTCVEGFKGDPNKKCVDINECESDEHKCGGVGDRCVNLFGGFVCCSPGSAASECTDQLFSSDSSTISSHGADFTTTGEQVFESAGSIKTQSGGEYKVTRGYLPKEFETTTGKLTCTSYCPSHSECISGSCECSAGYGGNPLVGCEDVDECLTDPCDTSENEWCVNNDGGYTCCNPQNTTHTDCIGLEISKEKGMHLIGTNDEDTIVATSANRSSSDQLITQVVQQSKNFSSGQIILTRGKVGKGEPLTQTTDGDEFGIEITNNGFAGFGSKTTTILPINLPHSSSGDKPSKGGMWTEEGDGDEDEDEDLMEGSGSGASGSSASESSSKKETGSGASGSSQSSGSGSSGSGITKTGASGSDESSASGSGASGSSHSSGSGSSGSGASGSSQTLSSGSEGSGSGTSGTSPTGSNKSGLEGSGTSPDGTPFTVDINGTGITSAPTSGGTIRVRITTLDEKKGTTPNPLLSVINQTITTEGEEGTSGVFESGSKGSSSSGNKVVVTEGKGGSETKKIIEIDGGDDLESVGKEEKKTKNGKIEIDDGEGSVNVGKEGKKPDGKTKSEQEGQTGSSAEGNGSSGSENSGKSPGKDGEPQGTSEPSGTPTPEETETETIEGSGFSEKTSGSRNSSSQGGTRLVKVHPGKENESGLELKPGSESGSGKLKSNENGLEIGKVQKPEDSSEQTGLEIVFTGKENEKTTTAGPETTIDSDKHGIEISGGGLKTSKIPPIEGSGTGDEEITATTRDVHKSTTKPKIEIDGGETEVTEGVDGKATTESTSATTEPTTTTTEKVTKNPSIVTEPEGSGDEETIDGKDGKKTTTTTPQSTDVSEGSGETTTTYAATTETSEGTSTTTTVVPEGSGSTTETAAVESSTVPVPEGSGSSESPSEKPEETTTEGSGEESTTPSERTTVSEGSTSSESTTTVLTTETSIKEETTKTSVTEVSTSPSTSTSAPLSSEGTTSVPESSSESTTTPESTVSSTKEPTTEVLIEETTTKVAETTTSSVSSTSAPDTPAPSASEGTSSAPDATTSALDSPAPSASEGTSSVPDATTSAPEGSSSTTPSVEPASIAPQNRSELPTTTKETFILPTTTLAPSNETTIEKTKCTSSDECGNDGLCERRTGGCRCEPGFEGSPPKTPCVDVDECATGHHKCHDTARCQNYVGGYACFCATGFRKADDGSCEDIDECKEHNSTCCGSSAKCVNKPGTYTCECLTGFIGDGYHCVPMTKKPCESAQIEKSNCDSNSACTVDDNGIVDCKKCKNGFELKENGKECVDINECETGAAKCSDNAKCSNLNGTFSCSCNEGFRGDGFMCTDVDECQERNPCHPQADCTNLAGSFKCECNSGFEGDGIKCMNTLERSCEDVQKFCGRVEHVSCLSVRIYNGSISSVCECEPGYRLDKKTNQCVDIDECQENRHNCDPSSAVCVNNEGSFKCECAEGYEGEGGICTDIDECDRGMAGCDSMAMCINRMGSCGCKCMAGYTGDGAQCSKIEKTSEKAICEKDWVDLCEAENKQCTVDEEEVPQCGACLLGFQPINGTCQSVEVSGLCPHNNDCSEHADCIDVQPNSHLCVCTPGFIGDGKMCDDIDECSLHGMCDSANSACVNTLGAFKCVCKDGFKKEGDVCVSEGTSTTLIVTSPTTVAPNRSVVFEKEVTENNNKTDGTSESSSTSSVPQTSLSPSKSDVVSVSTTKIPSSKSSTESPIITPSRSTTLSFETVSTTLTSFNRTLSSDSPQNVKSTFAPRESFKSTTTLSGTTSTSEAPTDSPNSPDDEKSRNVTKTITITLTELTTLKPTKTTEEVEVKGALSTLIAEELTPVTLESKITTVSIAVPSESPGTSFGTASPNDLTSEETVSLTTSLTGAPVSSSQTVLITTTSKPVQKSTTSEIDVIVEVTNVTKSSSSKPHSTATTVQSGSSSEAVTSDTLSSGKPVTTAPEPVTTKTTKITETTINESKLSNTSATSTPKPDTTESSKSDKLETTSVHISSTSEVTTSSSLKPTEGSGTIDSSATTLSGTTYPHPESTTTSTLESETTEVSTTKSPATRPSSTSTESTSDLTNSVSTSTEKSTPLVPTTSSTATSLKSETTEGSTTKSPATSPSSASTESTSNSTKSVSTLAEQTSTSLLSTSSTTTSRTSTKQSDKTTTTESIPETTEGTQSTSSESSSPSSPTSPSSKTTSDKFSLKIQNKSFSTVEIEAGSSTSSFKGSVTPTKSTITASPSSSGNTVTSSPIGAKTEEINVITLEGTSPSIKSDETTSTEEPSTEPSSTEIPSTEASTPEASYTAVSSTESFSKTPSTTVIASTVSGRSLEASRETSESKEVSESTSKTAIPTTTSPSELTTKTVKTNSENEKLHTSTSEVTHKSTTSSKKDSTNLPTRLEQDLKPVKPSETTTISSSKIDTTTDSRSKVSSSKITPSIKTSSEIVTSDLESSKKTTSEIVTSTSSSETSSAETTTQTTSEKPSESTSSTFVHLSSKAPLSENLSESPNKLLSSSPSPATSSSPSTVPSVVFTTTSSAAPSQSTVVNVSSRGDREKQNNSEPIANITTTTTPEPSTTTEDLVITAGATSSTSPVPPSPTTSTTTPATTTTTSTPSSTSSTTTSTTTTTTASPKTSASYRGPPSMSPPVGTTTPAPSGGVGGYGEEVEESTPTTTIASSTTTAFTTTISTTSSTSTAITPISLCATVSCHNLATCQPSTGTCECREGFIGDGVKLCSKKSEADCVSLPSLCASNGRCDAETRSCECEPGYIGDGYVCSPHPKDCVLRSNLCSPEAICQNRRCQCLPGFTGDGVKCVSIHERASNCSQCDDNAHCVGGTTCKCNPGYFGNGLCCVPDPLDCVHFTGICHPNAVCDKESRQCKCSSGYSGNGVSCFPQKSCRTDSNVCSKNGICLPTGSCVCRHGFKGDGYTCAKAYARDPSKTELSDISSCATPCDTQSQLCISGECVCKQGFRISSVDSNAICQDIDECKEKTDDCDRLATCQNTIGSHVCTCPQGYVGDGTTCVPHVNQGRLSVYCEADGMTLVLGNETSDFEGKIFVKGQAENPHCSKSFSSLINSQKPYVFKVAFQHCDVQLLDNHTMASTVIVQKHALFLTNKADSYDLRCQYPIGSRNVESHVNVSELATTSTLTDANSDLAPTCKLSVTNEQQLSISSATVGDTLKLSLEVVPSDNFGILPRNCFAVNIESGERYTLTDETGCAIDELLFPQWLNVDNSKVQAIFRTFKWPDSSMIRFQCDCSPCIGHCATPTCISGARFRRHTPIVNEVVGKQLLLMNPVERLAVSSLLEVHDVDDDIFEHSGDDETSHSDVAMSSDESSSFATSPSRQICVEYAPILIATVSFVVCGLVLIYLCSNKPKRIDNEDSLYL